MIHRLFITRQQTAFIFIEADAAAAITESDITDAIEQTLTDPEWTLDHIEHGSPFAVSPEIADGWPVHRIEAQPAQSFAARSREIGVSQVTLRKWRDERGIAIFDDEAVKRHIASQRNHSFKIAAKFKASLSR